MLLIKKTFLSRALLILLLSAVSPHFSQAMNELDAPASDGLMEAIRTGSLQHLAAQLAGDIDLNVPRYDAKTGQYMYPLEAAIDFRYALEQAIIHKRTMRVDEAVRMLLEAGANPNWSSVINMMPLDCALKQLGDIRNNRGGKVGPSFHIPRLTSYGCALSIIKNLYRYRAASCEHKDWQECLSREELDIVGIQAEPGVRDFDQHLSTPEGKILCAHMGPLIASELLESMILEIQEPSEGSAQMQDDDGGPLPAKKKCTCVIQ